MSQPNDNLAKLQKLKITYLQEIQKTRFVTAFIIVFIIFLISAFFALGILFPKVEDSKKGILNDQKKYAIPCINVDLPLTQPSDITIRVLNGSGKPGLATAVAAAMRNRGFGIQDILAADFKTNSTQIRYGANAAAQARIVAENFQNSVLILDDREDGLIDAVIGGSFTNLIEEDMVTVNSRTAKLEQIPGCQNIDLIKPLSAIKHDSEKVAPFTNKDVNEEGVQKEE